MSNYQGSSTTKRLDLCDAHSFSSSTADFGIGLPLEKPYGLVFGEPEAVRWRDIGSLHNKHGYASGEHRYRGERHNSPSHAGTRLALHQFLVRSDDQDCNEKKGG
jgi:hypothetical protein